MPLPMRGRCTWSPGAKVTGVPGQAYIGPLPARLLDVPDLHSRRSHVPRIILACQPPARCAMSRRLPTYGLLLVFLATLSLTACESTSAVIPTSASDVQSQGTLKSTFTAEPATLHAEVLPGVGCLTTPAFGTRIIVIVNGGTNVPLHGVRFRFTDRTGLTALP